MDCEEIFSWLTSGPFPTGLAEDADVESHLMICPDCAALAEALRPAPDLFHESLAPDQAYDLPGYRGQALGNVIPIAAATRSLQRSTDTSSNTVLTEAISRLAIATRLFDQPQLSPMPTLQKTTWGDHLAFAVFVTACVVGVGALGWLLF